MGHPECQQVFLLTVQRDMKILWSEFGNSFLVSIFYLSPKVILPNQTELPIPVASHTIQILLADSTVKLFRKHFDPHLHFFVFVLSSHQIDNFSGLLEALAHQYSITILFKLELCNKFTIFRVEDLTIQDQIPVIGDEVVFYFYYIFKHQQIDVGQRQFLFDFVVVKAFTFKNLIEFVAGFDVALVLHLGFDSMRHFIDEG